MADEVLIPYGDNASETAILLLGAADELGYEPFVVRNQPEDGGFRVTEDVAEQAELSPADGGDDGAYDPSDHTVDEVKTYVEENPDQREAVLAAEQDGKNRSTLVDALSNGNQE